MKRKTINGQLLDVAAASALLGLSQRSLRGRVARKLVPYRKLNTRVVFVRSELDQFIDALPGCSLKEATANEHRRRKDDRL